LQFYSSGKTAGSDSGKQALLHPAISRI